MLNSSLVPGVPTGYGPVWAGALSKLTNDGRINGYIQRTKVLGDILEKA